MEYNDNLAALVDQVKQASVNLDANDTRTNKRIAELERSINELYLKHNRPGSSWHTADAGELDERKDAIGYCKSRRNLAVPKIDAGVSDDYSPTSHEIDEALLARKAMKAMFRHGDVGRLDVQERKSLSTFSFGSGSNFLLAPEQASRVLRCIVDPTDVTGLVDRVNISSGSIRFTIDNSRNSAGGWACNEACWANNPQLDLSGVGTLEIKAETLRYVVCATSDLLQDAAFDVERWIIDKVSRGMRDIINQAILMGNGVGQPLGLFDPKSGIPVCEVGLATPVGQFTWMDLIQLRCEIPMQWQDGCVWLMNQRTAALLFSMSDANSRPIFSVLPERAPAFMLAGSPVILCSWLPDVAHGSTPILYGNLKQTYTIVDRRALTLQIDDYSAGYCRLYKFDCRIGGNVTCPNSSRLLRIR
jgi:HK97 family phage major capsid protein